MRVTRDSTAESSHPGCLKHPSANKPFCVEHLDEQHYARDLELRVARRREEELVASRSWADLDPASSILCRDALAVLEFECQELLTVERFGIMLETEDLVTRSDVALGVALALERAGLVTFVVTGPRGRKRRCVARRIA